MLFWVSAFESAIAITLSGSSSIAEPDDCKLREWLFPMVLWLCAIGTVTPL